MGVCGDRDPLLGTGLLVHRLLLQHGLWAEHRLYPGDHAFFAIPVSWSFHTCFHNSIPCARDILAFLTMELPERRSRRLAHRALRDATEGVKGGSRDRFCFSDLDPVAYMAAKKAADAQMCFPPSRSKIALTEPIAWFVPVFAVAVASVMIG